MIAESSQLSPEWIALNSFSMIQKKKKHHDDTEKKLGHDHRQTWVFADVGINPLHDLNYPRILELTLLHMCISAFLLL